MRFLLLLALALVVAACDGGGEDATSRVRFIHAAPGADSLDVFIAGNAVFDVVRLGTVTPYAADIEAGQQPVRVRTSVGAAELLRFEVNLIPEGRQTIIAAGARQVIRPIVLSDSLPAPASGAARVRIVHAAALADSAGVLLMHEAPADTAAAFPALRFRHNTGHLSVSPGSYRLRVTPAGAGAPLLDEAVTLQAGDAVTLVVSDARIDGGLALIRAED